MSNWILYSEGIKINVPSECKTKIRLGRYILNICDPGSLIKYKNSSGDLLVVQGYIMPRIDFQVTGDLFQNIFNGISIEGPQYVNNFKGNFILLHFADKKILVLNDQFGVNKYFYSTLDNSFVASDTLEGILSIRKKVLSHKNLIKYLAFNYFINGDTIYEEFFYSIGSSYHSITPAIRKGQYFSIEKFLDKREINKNKIECIDNSSELWKKIIKQYIDFFNKNKIAQTLTAGLDSRLILAGFRANDLSPATFTFGAEESLDVYYAKKVASKLCLTHEHLYPNKSFFSNYHDHAKRTIESSSGMASIYRAHRFDAYNKMKKKYDVLFFGFIGSEVIRGLYPDGLTIPNIVTDFWLKNEINIGDYYLKNLFEFNSIEYTAAQNDILDSKFMDRPDLYMFQVMIPLHFAQDIALNSNLGINSVAPFWDLDFLEFQKNTPFFIDNIHKNRYSKHGHFIRRYGPYLSSKLISRIDKESSRISLGKGYSPSDYAFSMYYASIKFAFYKTFYKKQYAVPNFKYEDWFKKYLIEYLNSNNISFMNTNKLIHDIENTQGTSELSFLNIVKSINIDLILKEL